MNEEKSISLSDFIKMQQEEKLLAKGNKNNSTKEINPQCRMLWDSDNEKMWNEALDNYWNAVKPQNMDVEKELNSLNIETINNMDVNGFYNFLHDKYFPWKFTDGRILAKNTKILERYKNEDNMDVLDSIFKRLLNPATRSLSVATEIDGLATAGGSGLLAILFPNEYGTVDRFVVAALLSTKEYENDTRMNAINKTNIKVQDGEYLETVFRNKAKQLNELFHTDMWTPRKVDMVLWAIGR